MDLDPCVARSSVGVPPSSRRARVRRLRRPAVARITGNGTPSISQSSGFTISVAGVEGQKNGLILYGVSPTAVAWAIGNTSYVCVAPPVQRTPIANAGGTLASCDGVLALDFNLYMAANPASLGGPFAAGEEFYAQGWFRDTGAVKGTNLSNGLRFRLSP